MINEEEIRGSNGMNLTPKETPKTSNTPRLFWSVKQQRIWDLVDWCAAEIDFWAEKPHWVLLKTNLVLAKFSLSLVVIGRAVLMGVISSWNRTGFQNKTRTGAWVAFSASFPLSGTIWIGPFSTLFYDRCIQKSLSTTSRTLTEQTFRTWKFRLPNFEKSTGTAPGGGFPTFSDFDFRYGRSLRQR